MHVALGQLHEVVELPLRADVGGEAERLPAQDLVARDGRAPVFLDMPGDQVVAGEMVHPRLAPRVVHAVGHVPHQDDVLPLANHLPDRERPAQHAHVLVHAHDDDVGDAALAHQIVGLRAVRDCVAFLDFDGCDLPPPGRADRARRVVVATAVRIVNRQRRLASRVRAHPALERRPRRGRRRRLRKLAPARTLVELHRLARAMDDQHPAGAQGRDELVHAGRHFRDARGRALAPVLVPHIADDGSRGLRRPVCSNL